LIVVFLLYVALSLSLEKVNFVPPQSFERVEAAPFVSNTLGSNMVLQQAPQSANLWGWSNSGDSITVNFNNNNYQATANSAGYWILSLPPTQASLTAYTITVKGAPSGNSATLSNVLFGDVYFCSGQSNMQFTVDSAYNATTEVAEANNYPNIRVFTVGQGTWSFTALPYLNTIEQTWSVASSSSIGGGNWTYMSALCWFTGRDIYNIVKIPIGLVSSNWGGTLVQAWSSPTALPLCPNIDNPCNVSQNQQNCNSTLYNAMVVPYLNMRLRGYLWYQGESNAWQPGYYACSFPAMITDWRVKWGYKANDTVFVFVQLAPWTGGGGPTSSIGYTRLAQEAALNVPNVYMATAIDLGDISSPFGNIHPRNKQELAYRATLIIQRVVYGINVNFWGPIATTASIVSTTPQMKVLVNFVEQSNGLAFQSASCPTTSNYCAWFDIGTSDGSFTNATATIVGTNRIQVVANPPSTSVTITHVRYVMGDWPVCTLYNSDNLPAYPFDILPSS